MKKIFPLIVAIAIPLGVGAISGYISMDAMEDFDSVVKPPLYPPAWLFPVVWTALYILMGIASYLVYMSDETPKVKQNALTIYGIQLVVNFFWPIIFFNLSLYFFAAVWLAILWVLILASIFAFRKISSLSAYLLIPYILWVSFAGYLNIAIYLLN